MTSPRLRNAALRAAIAPLFFTFSSVALAGGTAYTEVNASGMGSAYAGNASEAADPSVLFANPAALTRFKRVEVTQGAVFVSLKSPYKDANGQVFERDRPAYAIAPFNYVAIPVTQRLVLGASASASHGLIVRYPQDFPGNTQGTDTDLKVIRLNFGAGYKVTDTLSLGANASYDRYFNSIRLHINYRSAVTGLSGANTVALLDAASALGAAPAIPTNDSSAKIAVLGYAFNGQVGALWEPSANTRVGFGFRPKTKFKNQGFLNISRDAGQQAFIDFLRSPAAAAIDPSAAGKAARLDQEQQVNQDITLPSELNLSVFHSLTPRLDVMAGFMRQDFSVTKLRFTRRDDNDSVIQDIPQNFVPSKRYAVGLNYKLYKRLTVKAGFAKENSVVSDQFRIPALPDSDRRYYNIGAGLQLTPDTNVQLGYQRLNTKGGAVGNNQAQVDPPIGKPYQGNIELKVDFVGVQLNQKF